MRCRLGKSAFAAHATFPLPAPRRFGSLIYRQAKHLRAVQARLGDTKIESAVRYPGMEVDDARRMLC